MHREFELGSDVGIRRNASLRGASWMAKIGTAPAATLRNSRRLRRISYIASLPTSPKLLPPRRWALASTSATYLYWHIQFVRLWNWGCTVALAACRSCNSSPRRAGLALQFHI